jgi:hypothetical protein
MRYPQPMLAIQKENKLACGKDEAWLLAEAMKMDAPKARPQPSNDSLEPFPRRHPRRFSASPFQPKHASSSGASSYSSVLGGGSAIVLTFVPGTAADRAIAEGTSSPLSTIMQVL